MKQRLCAIFHFYLTISLFAGLTSLALWGISETPLNEDFHRFLPLYVVIKIFLDALLWWYLRKQNTAKLFFYFNLGISEIRLYISAFVIDMVAFFLLIFLIKMYLAL